MDARDEMSIDRYGLVNRFTGSVTHRLAARPEQVLAAVTDVRALAGWNDAIEAVAEAPDDLTPGAEWVVVMHPRGWPRWRSRSTVEEIDRDALRFVHTTRTDDGNPSWGTWTWQVRPAGDAVGSAAGRTDASPSPSAADLTVTWDLRPRTLGRRSLIARLRRPMLQREVRRSLDALDVRLRA